MVPALVTRVLLAVDSLERGGAETYVARVAPLLRRYEVEAAVCALDSSGPLAAQLRATGVAVHGTSYPLRSTGSNTLVLARVVREIAGLLRSGHFDLVHSYLFWSDLLGASAGRLAGRRVVVSRRALHAWRHGPSAFLHALESAGNLLADELIANSEAVLRDTEAHERFLPRRRGVVYNGVEPTDYPAAQPGRAGQLRIVSVGALSPRKGQEFAIEALALLPPGLDAKLRLVGAGPDESALRRLAAERRVEARVEFLGNQEDPRPELAAADLFLLPSRQEGFSNSLLESMASGLPVVATDVGGNAEALVDGQGGRIVPPGDPAAIAAAIQELAEHRSRLAAMGAANRERVASKFTLDASAEALAGRYHVR